MNETTDLHHAIGAVEAKVDILLDRSKGFDTRLSAVEKKVWLASGAAGIVGFIVASLVKIKGNIWS